MVEKCVENLTLKTCTNSAVNWLKNYDKIFLMANGILFQVISGYIYDIKH